MTSQVQKPRQHMNLARETVNRLRSVRGLVRSLIADPLTLADKQGWGPRALTGTRPLRLCVAVAFGLLLAACTDTESAPVPVPSPVAQSAPLVAPAPAPEPITEVVVLRAPTRSPGELDAERQRTAFFIQEQLRAVEAERAAEVRRQKEAQLRHERILNETARRAAQRQAAILDEQYRRNAQNEIIDDACRQAQIAAIAADYRGELPSAATRRVIAACNQPSATDRWEQLVEILPEARSEWDTLAEAEVATWAEAELLEAEIRRSEAVRKRQAEIEAQILVDRIAAGRQQAQSEDGGFLERVTSALPAPLVQLVRQSVSRLEGLPARLGSRAAAVNQRAGSGAVTALALAQKIPPGIRAAGEDAMVEFIDSRHVSHIQSVSNNPALAADPNNLILEQSRWNLARGARNASAMELLRANADNAGTALRVAGPGLLAQTAQGCVIGAVMELPTAAAEQRLSVAEGTKSIEQAALEVAASTAATGLAGCALTAATLGVASTGVVSLGAPILIPIALAGGSVYVLTTSKRIWDSLSEEEQGAVLGQMDVSREVVGKLSSSTWAATQIGGAVVAAAIQATADEAGWWDQSDPPESNSAAGN